MQERTFFVLTDPLATLGLLQCLVSHVLFPISIWFEIDRNSEFLSPVTLIAFVFWISRIVYLPSHSIFSLTLGHLPCLSQSERTRVCCIFDGLTEMSFLSHKIPYQTINSPCNIKWPRNVRTLSKLQFLNIFKKFPNQSYNSGKRLALVKWQ